MVTKLDKVLYRANVTSTGGRDGRAVSSDGILDIKLGKPKEMGGAGEKIANPELLFAAGYSACFLGAIKYVAGQEKIAIPDTASVKAVVGIGPIPTGFGLEVELQISLPGLDSHVAKSIVDKANIVCPYSNATHGNIIVTLTLI